MPSSFSVFLLCLHRSICEFDACERYMVLFSFLSYSLVSGLRCLITSSRAILRAHPSVAPVAPRSVVYDTARHPRRPSAAARRGT
ncbi:hypothetical protein B0H13DRAFT_2364005 [Mycena leptocephala]|nr:hypothetical protein B0H13DRAFT_2364005 [Mycena leptocephala]